MRQHSTTSQKMIGRILPFTAFSGENSVSAPFSM
jgi:hypothetical protein